MGITIVIAIIWIIVAYIVAYDARNKGWDFGTYLAIGLFLSPLLSLIILAIKGEASKDAILDNNSHIYFCPKCKQIYSNHGTNFTEECPDCHLPILETTILTDDWRKKDSSQKEKIKKEIENGLHLRNITSTTQINSISSNADEIKKYKDLLDQGAITQEEYNEKKKQLLGL